ncbi:hypothetical protein K8I28_06510 [bacterium]|nr:hypothetical protein [bacterium]
MERLLFSVRFDFIGLNKSLLCLFLLFCIASQSNAKPLEIDSFSISYWNDTADTERMIEEGWFYAQDDYVTYAAAVQLTFKSEKRKWQIGSHYKAITYKDYGYRTDLVDVQFGSNFQFHTITSWVSAGLLGMGNLGGASIQNSYHKTRSHSVVALHYPEKTSVGITIETHTNLPLVSPSRNQVFLQANTFNTFGTGYNHAKLATIYCGEFGHFIVKTSLGYKLFYELDSQLNRAFQNGIEYRLDLGYSFNSSWRISAWLHANAYRNDQSAQGFTLTWRKGKQSENEQIRMLYP